MNFAAIVTYLCLLILFYHFIGYPMFLWLLTKISPTLVKKNLIEPKVSILISAYNEEAVIKQKLESCFSLEYPQDKLEVIIVSDGSTDATASIISDSIITDSSISGEAMGNVKLVENVERQGKSNSLNRAVNVASGEILLISDANAMLEPSSLSHLIANFADASVGCVSGSRQLIADGGSMKKTAGLYWRYESAIKRWESNSGSTMGVLGSMLAIRRELFSPIPATIINDDFYLAFCALKEGQRVIYEPTAVCWAYPSQSVEQDKIRRRRISAGRFQHLLRSIGRSDISIWNWVKLISHKYLRLFLLVFMICGLLANCVAILQTLDAPFINILLLLCLSGQIAFYILALFGSYIENQIENTRIESSPILKSGIQSRLPAIAYYILSGAVASILGVYGYIRGTQTVFWHKAARATAQGNRGYPKAATPK